MTYCIPSSFTRGRTAALKDNISVMRGGWYWESDVSAGAASITPAPSGGLTYRNLVNRIHIAQFPVSLILIHTISDNITQKVLVY